VSVTSQAAGPGAARGLLPSAPPEPAPVRWLGALVDWSVVAIGAVMVVLVFVNVVMHVFDRDNPWTTELCELLMVWVTFLGGAAAARRELHMTITEFLDKLGPAQRKLADLAILALSAVVLALLVWFGMGIVNSSWNNILTVLQIPMAVQYLALPVGAGATLVFVLNHLVRRAAAA
jgi:TRAP-type transport system small permease protein